MRPIGRFTLMNEGSYTKDFEGWNPRKQRINAMSEPPFYHEREVWWCALGVNVGDESDGTGENFDRPVLVIRGFSRNVFFGVALTGRRREGRFYIPLGKIAGDEEDRESSVVLSQARLIDARRLVRKMTTLDEKIFMEVKVALQNLLFGPVPTKKKEV